MIIIHIYTFNDRLFGSVIELNIKLYIFCVIKKLFIIRFNFKEIFKILNSKHVRNKVQKYISHICIKHIKPLRLLFSSTINFDLRKQKKVDFRHATSNQKRSTVNSFVFWTQIYSIIAILVSIFE